MSTLLDRVQDQNENHFPENTYPADSVITRYFRLRASIHMWETTPLPVNMFLWSCVDSNRLAESQFSQRSRQEPVFYVTSASMGGRDKSIEYSLRKSAGAAYCLRRLTCLANRGSVRLEKSQNPPPCTSFPLIHRMTAVTELFPRKSNGKISVNKYDSLIVTVTNNDLLISCVYVAYLKV